MSRAVKPLRPRLTGIGRALRTAVMGGALALSLSLAPQARAETIGMTLDQARGASIAALEANRPAEALMLAEGVLLGAPDDLLALYIKARALHALGQRDDAVDAARRVWAESDGATERYFAAVLMGQMQSSAGSHTVSQFWLRRAAQLAPEDELKTAAMRDFRQVRRRNPWRMSLDVSAAPSDNLNNAPTKGQEVLTGIVTVTPPLSGVRYGGELQVRRSVMLSPRSRLHFGAFGGGSAVKLSSDARSLGGEAEDYSRRFVGLALGWETRNGDGDRLLNAQLSAKRHWLAGELLADVTRLDLGVQQALGSYKLGARIGMEDTQRHDSSVGDAQRRELGLSLARPAGPGVMRLRLDLGETFSAASSIGRQDGVVSLRYGRARPVKGMLPSLTLAYGVYNYDAPWGGMPSGPAREDRSRLIEVNVLLPELDYYGFAPEIGVSFEDRSSNYNLYESRGTDLRFGLKSVF